MACPKALNYTPADLKLRNYSRDFRLAKWGSEVKLQSSKLEPSTSQKGQSRHFEPGSSTSAKPPITEVASPYSITSSALT